MASGPNPPSGASAAISRPARLMELLWTPAFLVRAGVVLLLTLYLRIFRFEFVYDDLMIQTSPHIQSWHGIIDVFHNDVFGTGGATLTSYYRPVAAMLMVVVARLGSPTPTSYHVMALIVTLLMFLAAFWCGKQLMGNEALAALAAVLFSLHPAKVETIAWVSSAGCDGQSAIYFLLVLGCYATWWQTRRWPWLLGSAVVFEAAMFTKETMVVLPVLIAVHWLSREAGKAKIARGLLLMAPYCVAGLVYLAARRAVLKPLAASSTAIQPVFTSANWLSAPLAFWWYVKQMLLPLHLSILHDWTTVTQFSWIRVGEPVLGLVLLAGALIWMWRRTRAWQVLFFSAWFVLVLAPPIAMSPALTVHDRYLQLAVYPFCVLLAYGMLWLWRSGEARRRWAVAALLLLTAGWSAITWHETGYWDNSISLWQHAVEVAPHSVNARLELARLYSGNDVPAAVAVLDDGLRQVPNSPGLWRMRGLVQFNAQQYDAARASLQRSIYSSERFGSDAPADVKYGRATCAYFLGQIAMEKHEKAEADHWLRMAVEIAPENADYQRLLEVNRAGNSDEVPSPQLKRR